MNSNRLFLGIVVIIIANLKSLKVESAVTGTTGIEPNALSNRLTENVSPPSDSGTLQSDGDALMTDSGSSTSTSSKSDNDGEEESTEPKALSNSPTKNNTPRSNSPISQSENSTSQSERSTSTTDYDTSTTDSDTLESDKNGEEELTQLQLIQMMHKGTCPTAFQRILLCMTIGQFLNDTSMHGIFGEADRTQDVPKQCEQVQSQGKENSSSTRVFCRLTNQFEYSTEPARNEENKVNAEAQKNEEDKNSTNGFFVEPNESGGLQVLDRKRKNILTISEDDISNALKNKRIKSESSIAATNDPTSQH